MVSSSSSKEDFLKTAMMARNMVEEAKALSTSLRPHDGLSYDLLTLSPVLSLHELGMPGMPSLCVRVMRRGQGHPTPVEVALWSFNTFQNRLNLMRRAHQERSLAAGSHINSPDANPWRELTTYSQGVARKPVPAGCAHQNAVGQPCTTVYRPVQPARLTTVSQSSTLPVQPLVPVSVAPIIVQPPSSCASSPRIARQSGQSLEQASASASPISPSTSTRHHAAP